MSPRVAIGFAIALCAGLLVFRSPSAAQTSRGFQDEVNRRLSGWDSTPVLQPFASTSLPNANVIPKPKTRALSLHIGVNRLDARKYPGVPFLDGCENDARTMKEFAESRGYESKLLLSEDATAEHVLAEMRQASKTLKAGEYFLITFAGHGSLVKDFNRDQYPRLTDQAFCMYDRMLVDDEVVDVWPEFAEGVRVLMVLDACHSGTSSVGEAQDKSRTKKRQPLSLPKRDIGFDERKIRAVGRRAYDAVAAVQDVELERLTRNLRPDDAIARTKARVMRLAACKGDQVSLEDGRNGKFTTALINTLQHNAALGGYRELIYHVGKRTIPDQEPTLDYYGVDVQTFLEQPPFAP